MKSAFEAGRPKNEIAALTGIRGVAAVYVVFYHYFYPVPLTTHALCFLGHGYLAVDLFFVLSGFVMALANMRLFAAGAHWPAVKQFIIRRVARLYPLYLFCLLLALPLSLWGKIFWRGGSQWKALLPNVLLVQDWAGVSSLDDPSWSISAECLAYCLFPALAIAVFYRSKRIAQIVAAASFAAILLMYILSIRHGGWPHPMDLFSGRLSLLRCVSEFSLGVCTYKFSTTPAGQAVLDNPLHVYGVSVAILVMLAFRGTDLAIVLLLGPLILMLTNRDNLVSRAIGSPWIEKLGQLSFSIYLLHVLLRRCIGKVEQVVVKNGYSHGHTFGVGVTLPLLVICSYLTYKYVEMPGRGYIRAKLVR